MYIVQIFATLQLLKLASHVIYKSNRNKTLFYRENHYVKNVTYFL